MNSEQKNPGANRREHHPLLALGLVFIARCQWLRLALDASNFTLGLIGQLVTYAAPALAAWVGMAGLTAVILQMALGDLFRASVARKIADYFEKLDKYLFRAASPYLSPAEARLACASRPSLQVPWYPTGYVPEKLQAIVAVLTEVTFRCGEHLTSFIVSVVIAVVSVVAPFVAGYVITGKGVEALNHYVIAAGSWWLFPAVAAAVRNFRALRAAFPIDRDARVIFARYLNGRLTDHQLSKESDLLLERVAKLRECEPVAYAIYAILRRRHEERSEDFAHQARKHQSGENIDSVQS